MSDRRRARALARAALERGDPTGWFEALYVEAARGDAVVPWDDHAANPHVLAWLDRDLDPALNPDPNPALDPNHRLRALDVGCGFGDTAEALAARGLQVDAFDVSAAAIDGARARHPASRVRYRVADLLDLPPDYVGAFDLVVECYTLQVLPPALRPAAAASLRRALAPGGRLLVVARGRDLADPPGEMPWPLTRGEVIAVGEGLELLTLDDLFDDEDPPVRRLRAVFRRPRP